MGHICQKCCFCTVGLFGDGFLEFQLPDHGLFVVNTVFFMVESVVYRCGHLPAGFISAAGTVNISRIIGELVHADEYIIKLSLIGDLVFALLGSVGIASQVIFQIQHFKLFIVICKTLLGSIGP